jgi:hypothetical protein
MEKMFSINHHLYNYVVSTFPLCEKLFVVPHLRLSLLAALALPLRATGWRVAVSILL